MLSSAADFDIKLPLSLDGSGSYFIDGQFENGEQASFLVDTGAGIVVLSKQTFDDIAKTTEFSVTDRIAARMADGRNKAVNVYTLEHLILGGGCDVGPIKVAVIPGSTQNILGMNVLIAAAPFAVYTSPPILALSSCGEHLVGQAIAHAN